MQNESKFKSKTLQDAEEYFKNVNIKREQAKIFDKLTDNFLDNIITRIFRNLEICDLTKETNLDLISEIYYSLKCLKLLNCINTEQMINLFGKHLFLDDIIVKGLNNNNK